MNKLKINAVFLPTNQTCKHYSISKEDIVKQFYENNYNVDYSLPKDWVYSVADTMNITIDKVICKFVWGYEKGRAGLFGQPLPLTIEGYNLLSKYNHKNHKLGE